jgi:N-acetylmuramoyl-L-alanine amidase
MQVINHRLCRDDNTPYPFVLSPNTGGTIKPEFLVIHYTGGQSAQAAITWLTNRKSLVSSHLVIGADGAITQLVPFNIMAWHAGLSSWEGRTNLNRYSLGIELDYPGPLTCVNNHWVATFKRVFDDAGILEATAKFGTRKCGWPPFAPDQLAVAAEVAATLMKTYGLKEIVGHDDIAPARKWDPGPAFPWESFRTMVIGHLSTPPPPVEPPPPPAPVDTPAPVEPTPPPPPIGPMPVPAPPPQPAPTPTPPGNPPPVDSTPPPPVP